MAKKGVLLDIDGTLVDSNDAHTRAWLEAFERNGYQCDYNQVRRLIGMGADQLLPAAVEVEKDSPAGKKLSDDWKEIFESKYLPKLQPFPGSRALIEAMKNHGLKLAVASSSEKGMLQKLLKLAGVDSLIDEETSADDAGKSKPSPDIVQAALDRLKLEPGEALMLGDTPYDIEAARKLGVGTVAVRCGGWDDRGLKGAVAIYNDPTDLRQHLAESPFLTG